MDERSTKSSAQSPAQLAKAALRRLALDKLEPTPENYARAYAQEQGESPPPAALGAGLPPKAQGLLDKLLSLSISDVRSRDELARTTRDAQWDKAQQQLERALDHHGPGAQARALAELLERLVRSIQTGGRNWTTARKKESLQRVLDGSRGDVQRLVQRLGQLVNSWDDDSIDTNVGDDFDMLLGPQDDAAEASPDPQTEAGLPRMSLNLGANSSVPALPEHWPQMQTSLHSTILTALPEDDAQGAALSAELEDLHQRLLTQGANDGRAEEVHALAARTRLYLEHRHHLFGELGGLCHELTASLADLAEDDSWAQGQADAMRNTLELGLNARGVRSVHELLSGTRERQQSLRQDRARARDALKSLIQRMLHELGELGQHTDRFSISVGRYAAVIEQADSLESLTGAVREMVEESRSVQGLVQQTQQRLQSEHSRATELSERVEQLEGELRRLSDEVSTDQLTQIANRRGLVSAFEVEQAKLEREETPLALGLLDVDDFKKLNDSLGHTAGDVALKALATKVLESLRPGDMVARYGGEEFVVMLPNTPLAEAQQVLTRLQRSLTAGLFMHEGKSVFVTFSAGVTLYRPGERLDEALDRSDMALYEAKRTGKNRTCLA